MIYKEFSHAISLNLTNFTKNNLEVINRFQNIKVQSKDFTFINNFVKIKANKKCPEKFIEDSIEWFEKVKKSIDENKTNGNLFNIFSLFQDELRIKISETMHSKLLKFLLNPLENHGQGDKFLCEFLKTLNIYHPEEGKWKVTAEEGKVDILIKRSYPETIIIIENKSNWAFDQPNQLYRYWYNNIYLKTKRADQNFYKEHKDKYQIIYLIPNENKIYDSNITLQKPNYYPENLPIFIPMEIKYLDFTKEIQLWLKNCKAKLPQENTRIMEYINQYQLLCKSL